MKKINIIICAFASVIAFIGCAKNELSRRNVDSEITFNTVGASTKVYTGSKFTGDSFGTYAYSSVALQDGYLMKNEKIVKKDGVWKAESGSFYWPKTKGVDFISYYPYDPDGLCPKVSEDELKYEDYVVTDEDLMYAAMAKNYSGNVNVVEDDGDGSVESGHDGVPTIFRHALAKLSIVISTPFLEQGEFSWKIRLTNMTFFSIANKGSLTLVQPSGDDAVKSGIADWVLPESKVWSDPSGNEEISAPSGEVVLSGTTLSFPVVENKLVLPQEIGDQKVSFDYNIETYKNGELILTESDSVSASLKTATTPAWYINKSIVYNISVIPVYSEDGLDPVEITVQPTQADWDYVENKLSNVE